MSELDKQPRWGMVVDINRCVGCQTCTIACKHANDTSPGVQWRSVLDVENGTFPDVQREFLVVGCQHCANPPCVPVCPSGATAQRPDGLVTMDYDLCIGCAYCAVSCPYQARTIVHEQDWYYGKETVQERTVSHDDRLGVAQKCSFCIERVDEGLELGRVPGLDLDYTPACAASCVASAITFGDFNDPDSPASRLVADNPSFQMHAELGTDPQIKYLYELKTTPGRDPAPEDLDDSVLGDPAHPLVGKLQTFWDIKAAMNFILGGMGAGLAFLTMIAHFMQVISETEMLQIFTLAGIIMALGLFFVLLKIGRKKRFLYVLLRPQSSWMTRETYAVGLFYLALVLDLWWPQPWLHGLTGFSALVFLLCQARILYAAKGIPAWRAPLIPWLIVATGLLEGLGLFMLIHIFMNAYAPFAKVLPVAGMLLVIMTGCLWIGFRVTAKARGIPPLARQVINRISPAVVIPGYIIPLVGFAMLGNSEQPGLVISYVTAIGVVLGGTIWKYTIITGAGYQQGFSLPKLPQRGSGTRAAPSRIKSGSE